MSASHFLHDTVAAEGEGKEVQAAAATAAALSSGLRSARPSSIDRSPSFRSHLEPTGKSATVVACLAAASQDSTRDGGTDFTGAAPSACGVSMTQPRRQRPHWIWDVPRQLWVMYGLLLIEILGAALTTSVMWFLQTEELQMSDMEMSLVQSLFAGAQIVGSVVMGRLSDAYGRKNMITLSFLWAAAGFLFSGIAQNGVQFISARCLAGFSGGSISVTQAYVIDMSNPDNRGPRLGLLGAVVAIAFVVGPSLGAVLRNWPDVFGYRVMIFISAAVCLCAGVLSVLFLSESLPEDRRRPFNFPFSCVAASDEKQQQGRRQLPCVGLIQRCPWVLLLWGARLFSAVGVYSVYYGAPFIIKDVLSYNDQVYSWMLAGTGLLSALTMAGPYPYLDRKMGRHWVVVLGLCTAAIGACSMLPGAHLDGLWLFSVALAVFTLGFGCFDPALPNAMSLYVDPSSLGAANGLNTANRALGQVLGPFIAGLLKNEGWFGGVFTLATCSLVIAVAFVLVALTWGKPVAGSDQELGRVLPCSSSSSNQQQPVSETICEAQWGKQELAEKEEDCSDFDVESQCHLGDVCKKGPSSLLAATSPSSSSRA